MGKHYKGRHLQVFRGPYYHHGIGIGRGKVVHFQGQEGKSDSRIVVSTLAEFQDKSPSIEIVDTPTESSRTEIVERALAAVGSTGRAQAYSVATNNCEHFAVYCRTGQHPHFTAGQVGEGMAALLGGNLPIGILWLMTKGAGALVQKDKTSSSEDLSEMAEAHASLSEVIRSSPAYQYLARYKRRPQAQIALTPSAAF